MTHTETSQADNQREKKKMGRPPKQKHGEMLWVPAECVDFVKSYIELTKQKAAKQPTEKT